MSNGKTDRKESATSGVSRRSVLRGATLGAGVLTFASVTLSAERAEAKMTQQGSGYVAAPKDGQRCDGCSFFQAPTSCRIVDGTIAPEGWCRFFAKKS